MQYRLFMLFFLTYVLEDILKASLSNDIALCYNSKD